MTTSHRLHQDSRLLPTQQTARLQQQSVQRRIFMRSSSIRKFFILSEGTKMLHNFVRGVCGCAGTWKMDAFVENTIKEIREKVGRRKGASVHFPVVWILL